MRKHLTFPLVAAAFVAACQQAQPIAANTAWVQVSPKLADRHLAATAYTASSIDHTKVQLTSIDSPMTTIAPVTLTGNPQGQVASFDHLAANSHYKLVLTAYASPDETQAPISVDASSTTLFTTTGGLTTLASVPLTLADVSYDGAATEAAGVSVTAGGYADATASPALSSSQQVTGYYTANPQQAVESLAVGSDNALYFAKNHVIYKATGPDAATVVPGADVAAGFGSPLAIAVDAHDTVYVLDLGNNRVCSVANGTKTVLDSGLNDPSALVVDPTGGVYYDTADGLYRWTPGGGVTYRNNLNGATALAIRAGVMYVSFPGASVYTVDDAGSYTPFTSATIASPNAMAFDADGDLYVSSSDPSVKKFSPDGQTSQTLLNGGMLETVNAVAVDGNGVAYVAAAGAVLRVR